MSNTLMGCGHTAQTTDRNGNPACVICIGIDPRATQVVEEKPSLEGRYAHCAYARPGESCPRTRNGGGCDCVRPSSWNLAFFEYKPDKEYNVYYCGCFGWD